MIRTVIIEDELPILQLNELLLAQHGRFDVVRTYVSPLQALEEIPELQIDFLLVDVEMPGMNGVTFVEELMRRGVQVPVIFATAYKEYAVDAFQVQALDYVLKPITPKTVERISERLCLFYGKTSPPKAILSDAAMHLRLFGDGRVSNRTDSPIKWPTRVTEELFYFLYFNQGNLVAKWSILEAIWPTLTEDRAIANLYNSIYRLRQVFADQKIAIRIEKINDGYVLFVDEPLDCDWQLFCAFVREGQLGEILNEREYFLADQMWELLRGRLLHTKGYLWLMPMQEKLYQQALELTEYLLQYAQSHGKKPAIAGYEEKRKQMTDGNGAW